MRGEQSFVKSDARTLLNSTRSLVHAKLCLLIIKTFSPRRPGCCLHRLVLASMASSEPWLLESPCYPSLDFHLPAMTNLLKCIWKLRWRGRKRKKKRLYEKDKNGEGRKLSGKLASQLPSSRHKQKAFEVLDHIFSNVPGITHC